jgi:hypothetical protein
MAYIGKQPTIGNFVKLDSITTSATATYNLLNGGVAYSPQSPNHCIVSLNGVIQSPTTSFTISGSTIVFASALTANDVIDFILVLGDVLNIGTPSDATVGFAKVTSNLITGATAETSIAGGDSILIYDDSATALRKMTRTNFVAGVGGVNTPFFQAYRASTAQTLSSATWTKIQINTEVVDSASAYDNTTNYRFTPLSAGKYYIFGQMTTDSSTDMARVMSAIYLNGSQISQSNSFNDDSSSSYTATIVDMNGTTDYVELFGFLTSGGNTDLQGRSTFFGGFKLID